VHVVTHDISDTIISLDSQIQYLPARLKASRDAIAQHPARAFKLWEWSHTLDARTVGTSDENRCLSTS